MGCLVNVLLMFIGPIGPTLPVDVRRPQLKPSRCWIPFSSLIVFETVEFRGAPNIQFDVVQLLIR